MALLDEARKLAGVADRLKGPVGNEANTKALLVEPMLSALGWDTTNLDHVLRDWPVRDDNTIDYALRVGEENSILVEARGVNESLDDVAFTARAVDYVSDQGVLWCVITNGLVYRVYRTDELVPTEDKLSFEVDVTKAAVGSPGDCARLPLLSRASLIDGGLALWGEQKVFTDPRVRKVLSDLAAKPTAAFLEAINEAIGDYKVPRDRLRASLGRVLVLDSTEAVAPRAPSSSGPVEAQPRTPETPPRTPPQMPSTPQAVAPPGNATPVAVPPARQPAPVAPTPAPAPPEAVAPPVAPAPPEAPAPPVAPAPPEAHDVPGAGAAPDVPHAPEKVAEEPAATPETARRRFLGGPGRRSGSDPYAPLLGENPFADPDT